MPLNPLENADFADARGIDDQPALKWWVPCTLRLRDRIVVGGNKSIIRATHKHDVELPISVAYANKLDEKNGGTLWITWTCWKIEPMFQLVITEPLVTLCSTFS